MGPGPSDVDPRITNALARPTIGHLDPAFIGLMEEIKGLLQYAFQTGNPLTLPVSAPGSAGMESCFVNLVTRSAFARTACSVAGCGKTPSASAPKR